MMKPSAVFNSLRISLQSQKSAKLLALICSSSVLILIGVLAISHWTQSSVDVSFKASESQSLYLAGQLYARKLDSLQLNPEQAQAVINGFQDWTLKKKSQFNSENRNIIVQNYFESRLAELVQKEREKGHKFLETFVKSGGQTTSTGLAYKILKSGNDTKPRRIDLVEVEYHGSLPDGRVFDSTRDRKTSTQFPLDHVIPGWREGLKLIGEGGEIELIIPSDLAYGDQGSDPTIPGGATLIFKIKLVKVIHR